MASFGIKQKLKTNFQSPNLYDTFFYCLVMKSYVAEQNRLRNLHKNRKFHFASFKSNILGAKCLKLDHLNTNTPVKRVHQPNYLQKRRRNNRIQFTQTSAFCLYGHTESFLELYRCRLSRVQVGSGFVSADYRILNFRLL